MKNDLHKTFGQIFDDKIEAFRSQLIRVQAHQADRKEAEEWVKRLRFLDISKVPRLHSDYRTQISRSVESGQDEPALKPWYIPVTEQSCDNGRIPYIAVSWRWGARRAWDKEWKPRYDYRIRRPNAAVHKSEFPDEYLERVIMFAQEKKITKLWIDKECIYQRKEDQALYPKDRDLGVQIMDVVYGFSTASVGLLTTPLVTQDEIHILDSLVSKTMFSMADETDTDDAHFSVNFSWQKFDIIKVQMLILKILSDQRWSRGWIFQEDHLASSDMTLLIPYECSLHVRLSSGFEHLPGNLQVNVKKFREAVTMFCLASKEDENSWPTSEILSKAKQYKIWNKRAYRRFGKEQDRDSVHLWSDKGWKDNVGGGTINQWKNHQNIAFYPTMTNSVLADICSRSLENEEDRVAILANSLRFPNRLDTSPASPIVKPGEYSLSVAMLAQILINGEIIKTHDYGHHFTVGELMQETLQSYLRRCEYHFTAPSLRLEQSFIQRCRLRSPTITHRGIETKGFLFRILPYEPDKHGTTPNPLQLSKKDRARLRDVSRDESATSIPKGRKLDLVAHEAIHMVADKLAQIWPSCRLARFLRKHLQRDLDRAADTPRSTSCVLDMMSAVYQALRDGRRLSLACPARDPTATDPAAIFIDPHWRTRYLDISPGMHPSDRVPLVFTSWDAPSSEYDRERIASLEVAVFDRTGARIGSAEHRQGCFLRSYGWANGVFDFRGQRLETYCFPLPGITEGPDLSRGGKKRKKRKLG
ncbi:hypothetical protein HBI26_181230 [Parastagonospora nodorum]|nr:hypothetical protein HBI26_181230 [Parastagonospora nodorum]